MTKEDVPVDSTKEKLSKAFDAWDSARKSELKRKAGWDFVQYSINFLRVENFVVPDSWLSFLNEIKLVNYYLQASTKLTKPDLENEAIQLQSELIGLITGALYSRGYIVKEKVEVLGMQKKGLYRKILPANPKNKFKKENENV